jgi:hypothetical protein
MAPPSLRAAAYGNQAGGLPAARSKAAKPAALDLDRVETLGERETE